MDETGKELISIQTAGLETAFDVRCLVIPFVMGLCLLVYNLGQRQLRHALVEADQTLHNQLGQPTERPTLRWVFQCFQDVHLLLVSGIKQIANLTQERLRSKSLEQ